MNKTTPNSQNFPQFMQAETVSEIKIVSKTEIADFRFNPAVQNRPIEILNVEKEENGIVLTLGTMARRAMLSYTHETSLYLYKPADITAPKVYLHINFWTDKIFRVVFSKDKEIINHFAGLPEDAQMLIAKPEKVDFTLNETDNEITLTTSKIQVTINKETTRFLLNSLTAKSFTVRKSRISAREIFTIWHLPIRITIMPALRLLSLKPMK